MTPSCPEIRKSARFLAFLMLAMISFEISNAVAQKPAPTESAPLESIPLEPSPLKPEPLDSETQESEPPKTETPESEPQEIESQEIDPQEIEPAKEASPAQTLPNEQAASEGQNKSIEKSAEVIQKSALEIGLPESIEDLLEIQSHVRKVTKLARLATVAVEMNNSVGSGVIISPEGLVLTAGHVSVEPNREVWLRFPDNKRVKGRTLGVNHLIDSGLIQITAEAPDKEKGWPHTPLCTKPVKPGDWVIGLGQPNGFVIDRLPPVRLGRVLYVREDAINTDATLVGGDSGGPLLNLAGEVVGIHSRIGERITSNFHVPVGSYQQEWQRLLTGRMTGVPDEEDPEDSRPLVGISIRLQDGRCLVTQVFPNQPADEAGIKVGDILLKVNNQRVTSYTVLERIASKQEPFARIPFLILRGEEEKEVEVWLSRTNRFFPGLTGNEEKE